MPTKWSFAQHIPCSRLQIQSGAASDRTRGRRRQWVVRERNRDWESCQCNPCL